MYYVEYTFEEHKFLAGFNSWEEAKSFVENLTKLAHGEIYHYNTKGEKIVSANF